MPIIIEGSPEISGVVVAKLFAGNQTRTLRIQVIRNKGNLIVSHEGEEEIITLHSNVPIGIVDTRSVGFFHVKGENFLDALEGTVKFVDARALCDSFNRLVQKHNEDIRS